MSTLSIIFLILGALLIIAPLVFKPSKQRGASGVVVVHEGLVPPGATVLGVEAHGAGGGGDDRPTDERLTPDWSEPFTPNKEPYRGPYVTDRPEPLINGRSPMGFPR